MMYVFFNIHGHLDYQNYSKVMRAIENVFINDLMCITINIIENSHQSCVITRYLMGYTNIKNNHQTRIANSRSKNNFVNCHRNFLKHIF